jgi:type IV secretion system protein VirB6
MSIPCAALDNARESIAQGLRAIDCASGVAIHRAFDRFFGPDGALNEVLTIVLTLYVALFALRLLTGRGGLSISALTPRMLGIGLALTFATSWLAYQSVALNLALGAPDEIARIVLGSSGSATMLFANRLDEIFNAIAVAAQNMPAPVPTQVPSIPGVAMPAQPPATSADLLWLAALLLLLGTVGVLLVAKIALAALLVLGPIFIIMSLFGGTRGLFEGWLKAIFMLAITPLLAVILGGGTIALIGPMVEDLTGGPPEMRLAVAIFLGASVHVILMHMAIKASAMLVSGWRLPKPDSGKATSQALQHPLTMDASRYATASPPTAANDDSSRARVQSIFTHMNGGVGQASSRIIAADVADPASNVGRMPNVAAAQGESKSMSASDNRLRSIGQQYRTPVLVPPFRPNS